MRDVGVVRTHYPSDKGCGFYYLQRPEQDKQVRDVLQRLDWTKGLIGLFNRCWL